MSSTQIKYSIVRLTRDVSTELKDHKTGSHKLKVTEENLHNTGSPNDDRSGAFVLIYVTSRQSARNGIMGSTESDETPSETQ